MTIIEKENIGEYIVELAKKDPSYLREVLLKVKDDLKKAKRQQLEEIVSEDFEEYEEVFRALA